MGSLRNPVGPLPSTIYWRRRAVALCILALVALLVFWAVNSGGGGGGSGNNGSKGGHTPVSTITPGPDPTGTHITGRPGGRDTSGGSSSSGGSSGSTSGSTSGGDNGSSGSGGSAGTGDTSGGTSSSGGSGSTAGATSGGSTSGGSGGQLPVGSTLPDCSPGSVQLSLKSRSNSYAPGETPTFELRATNSGSVSCKVDFGPKKAVFTISAAAGDAHTWASDDCPKPGSGSYLLQVPAHSSTVYTLRWDGRTSSPACGTPRGTTAAPGTYLVQARLAGYGTKQVSFVLSQD
ncbi:hypothetical protein [Actinacidiphila alni]|uniref:hypothetical protein n=1 Tax=Actinacidiphila alni TaxID=380248 RepID=UPI003456C2A5